MVSILRINRSDAESPDYVLLRLDQSGPYPLDLKIVATEGTGPFAGALKELEVARLRTENYKGETDEWNAVLGWLLLKRQPPASHAEAATCAELSASVRNDVILIDIRQNVEGITQRLGSISLPRTEREEIELLEWTAAAADAAKHAESRNSELETTIKSQEEQLRKLRDQMQQFIREKKTAEDEMLAKFMQLLNNKKLKIRDQQRLLAGAKVDSTKAQEALAARELARSVPASGHGRPSKRMQTDDDDTELDIKHEGNDSAESSDRQTRSPSRERDSDDDDDGFEKTHTVPLRERNEDVPPVARALLFNHGQAVKPQNDAMNVDDEETDDEL